MHEESLLTGCVRCAGVEVYFLDGWQTPASTLQQLKDAGLITICYFS
jgi:hypothetical protein